MDTARRTGDRVEVSDDGDGSETEQVRDGLKGAFGEEQEVPRRGLVSSSEDGRVRTRRPDGSTEITYPDGRTRTELANGTVKTEGNGETRVEHAGGRIDLTRTREDGSVLERSTYRRDGAEIREQTIRQPNGESRSVTEVVKGGRTETTTAVTSNVEGDIHDLAPELHNGDASYYVRQVGDEDGPEGPLQRTRTVREVVTNGGEPRRLDDSTTYSQTFTAASDAQGSELPEHLPLAGPNSNFNEPGRALNLSGYDHSEPGQVRLAVTDTRLRDGQTVDERRVGVRSSFTARTDDGRAIPNESSYQLKMEDGKRVSEVGVRAVSGISADNTGAIFNKSEYRDRLGDGPIDYRETVMQNYDEQGRPLPASQRIEAGTHLDDPNQAGARTITVDSTYGDSNASLQRAWTYHRADADGQGGVRIQEQTSVQGSDSYTLTDGHIRGDSSHFTTRAYDGDRLLVKQVRDLDKVSRSDLDPGAFGGEADLAREFRSQNQDADYARETVRVTHYDGDEPETHVSRTYAARSGDRLQQVEFPDHPEENSTMLHRPGQDVPFRGRAANGDELQVDNLGRVFRVTGAGDSEQIGDLGQDALNKVDSGTSLASNISKLLQSDSSVATRVSPLLGGLTGALGLISADSTSEKLSGSSDVVHGISALSKGASAALSEGGLSRALGVGGKVLGPAGTLLGIGGGVAAIAEGDEFDGALSVAGGLGSGLGALGSAAGAGAVVPGIGWTVAGLAITTGLVKDVIEQQQAEVHTHALQID